MSIAWLLSLCWLLAAPPEASAAPVSPRESARPAMLIVIGAPGSDEYASQFQIWAQRWRNTAEKGGVRVSIVGDDPAAAAKGDREAMLKWVESQDAPSDAQMWIVMLGHGTFDGRAAKFNLRGPDITAAQLAESLKRFERPVIVVNTSSASGPWLPALAGKDRIVITATKSGYEQNFTRFGGFLATAIGDAAADLDKDGQTSLLEAFLVAWRLAAEFFESDGRLATEHALLDDNADALGTRGDWYQALRAVKRPADKAAPDGPRAHQVHLVRSDADRRMPAAQRARRDALEMQVLKLRDQKAGMDEAAYYVQLERLLLELAGIYESQGDASAPRSK